MESTLCLWLYTDTSIVSHNYINFVESKLDIVMINIDFISYHHLPQMVPFLMAGHIYYTLIVPVRVRDLLMQMPLPNHLGIIIL